MKTEQEIKQELDRLYEASTVENDKWHMETNPLKKERYGNRCDCIQAQIGIL